MNRIVKKLAFVTVGSVLLSCTTSYQRLDLTKNSNFVWPPLPAVERIAYVGSLFHPSQLGVNKGFLSTISELLTGATEQRLIRPMGITITSEKVFYIADPGAKCVHRYDVNAGLYGAIRLADNIDLPSPVALATGPADDVLIVDSEQATVYRASKNSAIAEPFINRDQFVQPTGIAYDPGSKHIYVTDTGSHQVKVFSSDGKQLFSFGKRGKNAGEFNYPTMIWQHTDGRLYVTDSLNFRIQVFDRMGKFISYFGQQGDGTGHLSRPKGVATDSYGHVYVVDGLFHLFQLFDSQGRFLLHVGQQGQQEGEFWLPTGIFISADNLIYVADSHNQRIQIFRYVGGAS